MNKPETTNIINNQVSSTKLISRLSLDERKIQKQKFQADCLKALKYFMERVNGILTNLFCNRNNLFKFWNRSLWRHFARSKI